VPEGELVMENKGDSGTTSKKLTMEHDGIKVEDVKNQSSHSQSENESCSTSGSESSSSSQEDRKRKKKRAKREDETFRHQKGPDNLPKKGTMLPKKMAYDGITFLGVI